MTIQQKTIKSTINLVLIGAGQLGSRHLQSLASFENSCNITVIDPSADSLQTAKERLNSVLSQNSKIEKIDFVQQIAELKGQVVDLCIIASTANYRRQIIEELIEQAEVKNLLLEKILFQKPEDYVAISKILQEKKIKAWVNLTQRMWPFFEEIKELCKGQVKDLSIIVSGSQWGLGCNGIHNADLLPFLTGDEEITFQSNLDESFIESKRAGFIEFTGRLQATDSKGNTVIQNSFREGNSPFIFEVISPTFRRLWNVAEGKSLISEEKNNWIWQEVEMKAPYQSQLTHIVAQDIIEKGNCVLPTYEQSAQLHLAMLKVFIEHLQKDSDKVINSCPIT